MIWTPLATLNTDYSARARPAAARKLRRMQSCRVEGIMMESAKGMAAPFAVAPFIVEPTAVCSVKHKVATYGVVSVERSDGPRLFGTEQCSI